MKVNTLQLRMALIAALFVLLLSLAGVTNVFAQQRVAKNDIRSFEVDSKKGVALGNEVSTPSGTNIAPRTAMSAVVNRYGDVEDCETMWTYYDLQSNGWCSNRMYQLSNGSVAVAATMSHITNSADRGTGYNFYNAETEEWQDMPENRIENVRTGWPSIAQWGETGEILINHAPMRCWTREVAGEGEWVYRGELPIHPDEYPYTDDASWPRIATSGDNHNIVHVIADIQHSGDVVEHYQVYLRSEDADYWEISYSPLAQDNEETGHYSADSYSITANGHNVAIIYGDDPQSHVVMYKSTDDGQTWTRTVIWQNPYYGYDWETDPNSIYSDTVYGPANLAIAIDNNGVTHVAMSTYEYIHSELGSNYTTFCGRNVDGIYYWNDTQEAPIQSEDGNLHHALRLWWPDPESPEYLTMHNDPTKWIGYVPMYDGYYFDNDKFFHENDYFNKSRSGLSTFPALSIDPMGNIACAYSAPNITREDPNTGYYLRNIYVSYRNVDNGYWEQAFDDITNPELNSIFNSSENIFTNSVDNTTVPSEFWFSFQSDNLIGCYVGSNAYQTSASENYIHAVKVVHNPGNDDPLTYSINDDGVSVTVTGHVDGTNATGELIIPAFKTIDGVTYTVTAIGDFAFDHCSGLTGELTIPNSVTTIGLAAFQYCYGFTGELIIPNSVTSIGDGAFNGCIGFTGELTIPNSVTTIGFVAFQSCRGFTGDLIIPNSVTTISGFAFNGCSGFTGELTIPNSVTVIDSAAFGQCIGFTGDLTIPNSVTTIGGRAFRNCSGFTSLTIGNAVTTIGNEAFRDCIGFTGDLIIPNSVITIGDEAFRSNRFTGNLIIGNSVTEIGSRAFWGSGGFSSLDSYAEIPPSIGTNAFSSIFNIPVTVPCGTIEAYQNASGWDQFTNYYENCASISATVQPDGAGTVSGSGDYAAGSTCTLGATAAEGYFFLNWTQNDNVVSTNPTYSFTVTGNANYVANFSLGLPELHITGITHSTLVAGQEATISWTVQNDGTASTPNGALWSDRVWLSIESNVNVNSNNPILLGTFDNLSALNVGEYYTQTKTVNIPLEISNDYYLFVTTDAYDAYQINWDNNVVPIPYNPPPYISCFSHGGNVIYEQSEKVHGYPPGSIYNDNFFYELVNIEVPILPDLQVTSIIPQTNFFSGSTVNVTATINNLGENTTLTDHWADALYIASEPDFNSSSTVCLAVVPHSGQLPVGQSYQVQFAGQVPLTMYGEAYFFVYTDCYEQVYEHVLNHNNITMSEAVNVILSPPADLEPSDLTVPATVSTGEVFAYSYKVNNIGAGNPNVNNWVDKIYLCQNADILDASAILLKTVSHYGGLQPGANYSVSESMVLPSNVTSGTYYLYVHADANNAVFEYLYDGNNLARSNAINVIQPDLQVTQITAPEQIKAGYPLNLSYTLTNAAEGIVRNSMVTDRVYISSSGNMTDTIRIANIRRNVYLAAGQSLTVMCNDLAPYQLTDGTYHLIVLTDCDDEINESNEGNNTLSHYPMSVLHQPLPDLQPVSLTIPDVIQAGENVAVEFDITNNGDMDLLNSNCTFNIYAAWDDKEILCPVQSQTLPLGSTVSIGIGQTVHFARTVLVPPTVTSACSTFELIANKGCLVPELDTTNNVYTATATVLDCPLPDLVVTNISATAIQSGVENQVSFIVKNNGTANFEGSFNTTVYVRSALDTILCPLVLQVSPEVGSYSIPIGGILSITQNVFVPPMANASCNILEVVLDEENLVLESNDDNNATTMVVTVLNYPFDLKTTALQVTESVWAGETTSLTWTVKNIGTCPSGEIPLYVKKNGTYTLIQGELLPQPWVDKVFVSTDAVLSDDDIELCSMARSTVVQPNGTYTVEQSVTLPYTHLGAQYLLCVSDATRVTYDSDTLNNVKSIPIEVQLGSLPDLRITSLTVEEELTCDRAYWVHYTVVNEGERVTQKENWTDALFIGEAMTHIGAFQLSSKIHHGALEVGESYTDSIEILIPNGLEGDYFLVGFTDRTNQIYEHNNEDDNILALPVTVQASDPCDLIAIQPEFPVSLVSGEDMMVSWQLRNIGYNPAIGRVRNAVYLSTDAEWSSDDMMLGYADMDINIPNNGQQVCSLSGVLTGFGEGNHYVIVRVNILNALNESTYENNVCVSMLTTEIGFPTLVIGETIYRTMLPERYLYYKIEVGQEYEGQTLMCHLESLDHDLSVSNGIYLSYESTPTPSDFDYGVFVPYSYEQEILIPALKQGTYYLMAQGAAFQVGSIHNEPTRYLVLEQNISISTSIINFEILSIDADHGANTGSITTKITGAKFDSIMDFRLVQGNEYLPAEKVFFSNSTETYTTFDLAEMPLGVYAMEAELPGGIITIKDGAFTIEEGLPAELAINIVAPASVRSGNTFAVNIEYGNIGTTDLNVSGFVVVSRNGHPIGFSTEELQEGQTELTFYTAEGNGNPDVLRPGYLGTKAIMVKATPSTYVSLAVFAIRRQY
jgi:subtilase family serine protease